MSARSHCLSRFHLERKCSRRSIIREGSFPIVSVLAVPDRCSADRCSSAADVNRVTRIDFDSESIARVESSDVNSDI